MKESTNWLCTVAAYTKKTGKRKKYGHRQNALTPSNVYHFERRQFRGIYLFPCRAQRKLNNTFSVLTVTLRFSHTYFYLLTIASSAQAALMHSPFLLQFFFFQILLPSLYPLHFFFPIRHDCQIALKATPPPTPADGPAKPKDAISLPEVNNFPLCSGQTKSYLNFLFFFCSSFLSSKTSRKTRTFEREISDVPTHGNPPSTRKQQRRRRGRALAGGNVRILRKKNEKGGGGGTAF